MWRADSAGRRSATNREQRCAALGAVALPAGTTIGQGHLPRVGDGDLLPADASALWLGFRCLRLSCARFNHAPGSIFPPDWLSRGRRRSTRADLRSEHPLARLVGGLGLARSSSSCHETVTSGGSRAHEISVKDLVARHDRRPSAIAADSRPPPSSPVEQRWSGLRFDGAGELSSSQTRRLGADDRTPSFVNAAAPRRYPTGPVASSLPDECSGVHALFLPVTAPVGNPRARSFSDE